MTDSKSKWPLGERVKEARGTEAIKSVARRAGVGPETYWQIENGRRRDKQPFNTPSAPVIQAVARALRIPEAEALDLAGHESWRYVTPAADDGPPLTSPEELAKSIAQLPVDLQRALQTIIEAYCRERGVAKSQMVVKPGPAETPHSEARFGPEEPPLGSQSQGERVKSDS